ENEEEEGAEKEGKAQEENEEEEGAEKEGKAQEENEEEEGAEKEEEGVRSGTAKARYKKMLEEKRDIEKESKVQEEKLEKGNIGIRQLAAGIATGSATTKSGVKVKGRVNLVRNKLATDIAKGKIGLKIGKTEILKKAPNLGDSIEKTDTDILAMSAAGLISTSLLEQQKIQRREALDKAQKNLDAVKGAAGKFSLSNYNRLKEAEGKVSKLQAELKKLELLEESGKKLNEDIKKGVPVETAVSRFYDATHGYSSQKNMLKYGILGAGAALGLNRAEANRQFANLKEEWNQSPRLSNIIAAAIKGGPEGRSAAIYAQFIIEKSKSQKVGIAGVEESIPNFAGADASIPIIAQQELEAIKKKASEFRIEAAQQQSKNELEHKEAE
ncbi:MAG: hypothetical protein QXT43_03060, partial [Candidatus Micrarchaeaceae archaeon]